MTFGLIILVMTVLTVTVLTRPLLRKPQTDGAPDNMRDMAIYRAQLKDVENDIARGLLTEAQAAEARAEVQRRMLSAGTREEAVSTAKPRTRKIYATLIIILLPLVAVFIYAMIGAPGLPGQPYAARMKNPHFLLATAAQRMDQKLQTTPTAIGYRHFGDILYLLRDYVDAANAYRKSLALYAAAPDKNVMPGGSTAPLWSQMAETVVLANGGAVVAQAQNDFYQALQRDKKDPRALFYMGLAQAQNGAFKKAVAIWKKLQSQTPAGAPWAVMLKNRMAAAAKAGRFDLATVKPAMPAKPAPTSGISPLTAHGAKMPGWAKDPSARADMINAMVAALAAKLKKDPHNVKGWLRLIRSYRVLGRPAQAAAALSSARKANPQSAQLKALSPTQNQ